jgi:hypothetical protein
VADETRLVMLVGATIGFELARELADPSAPPGAGPDTEGAR